MIVNAQSTVDIGETVGRQLQTKCVEEDGTPLLQREKFLFLQGFLGANRCKYFSWNRTRLASQLFPSHYAVFDPVVAGQLYSGLPNAHLLGDAVNTTPTRKRKVRDEEEERRRKMFERPAPITLGCYPLSQRHRALPPRRLAEQWSYLPFDSRIVETAKSHLNHGQLEAIVESQSSVACAWQLLNFLRP